MVMPRTTSTTPLSAGGAESEQGRRPTQVSAPPAVPHELLDRPRRRRTFTASDKLRILAENDRAGPGDGGARFVDQAPAEVYASLLDEAVYHCSMRTMYRILHENNEVRERRQRLRHPVYAKPELLAEGPNQVWSWDITKLSHPKCPPPSGSTRQRRSSKPKLNLDDRLSHCC